MEDKRILFLLELGYTKDQAKKMLETEIIITINDLQSDKFIEEREYKL